MTPAILRLHPDDNVLIALRALAPGETLAGLDAPVRDAVPAGHKIATVDIAPGTMLRKYGQIIGQATAQIAPGAHVHSHNIEMAPHRPDQDGGNGIVTLPPARNTDHFMGYLRPDGRVGTRNFIGIVTSVNCAGSVAQFIAETVEKDGWLRDMPHIDGIVPIVHGTGCGMAAAGESYETLFRTIAGYAQHPNFGAILMVGLGCEVMQIADLVGRARMQEGDRFRYLTIQQTGGTRATVEKGVAHLREMAEAMKDDRRSEQPVSKLSLGMQCGGSDGYSGITANPALGAASDMIVQQGGITILSETPEIYGAEHLLTSRAVSADVAQALTDRVNWWEDYVARSGGRMDNNPSPGNKRGGLTTILEKSLGAVAKGGTAPLSGVYLYGAPITTPGFAFMDSPGYDPCSVTGQVASGANLVVFTTGRGSVSGYKPVPCLKLASQSDVYARMTEDMDIDCGDIVTSGVSITDKGREIYEALLQTASGNPTKSEMLGFGGVEFVPWQIGAVM